MTDVLLVVLYLTAGLVAGYEARRKGYDDWLFLGLALVLGPVMLLGMLFLPARPLAVGTPVRFVAPVQLDSGGRIPSGHVSVVREVDVIDGTRVCRITAPDRSAHWVSQEVLSRAGRAIGS
jgi:hypothetical protein